MSTSTTSSRPATASTSSAQSRRSTETDARLLFNPDPTRSKFDIWNLIKRPVTSNPYYLTARYRMCNTPVRRVRSSGVISRRRRKDSQASECGEFNRSLTTNTDVFDLEKDFLEEFDFDADDDHPDGSGGGVGPCSHSQGVYLRCCNRLKVSPNSYVFRNLVNDTLMLKHHLLGPEGFKPIAVALVENSSVTILDVEDNGLGVEGVSHLCEMFTENTFIVDLNLAQNNLKTEGVRMVLDKIKENDVVHKINLSGNMLQEYDGDLFTEYIEDTHNLTELRLNHNCFREMGGIALGKCLGWNESIEKLELRWNHLRNAGAKAVAAALGMNNTIKYLDVSWNGFYLDGCKEMAQSLLKNSSLEYLDLSSNRINKQCLQELVKGLKGNSTLKILRLGDNPVTAYGAYYFLNQMLEMPNSGLEEIDMKHQSVEPNFLELLERVKEVHPNLEVKYGAVLGQDVAARDEEQELMDENPVVVLMEFGNIQGYRLIDLFAMMDKDNSKTLTREEIKNGLLSCNIPLSEKALENLVNKLDEDGDGEIDYGELIAGKQMHRRKLTKTIMMSREQKVDMEETEVGRVRKKLKRLMDKKEEDRLKKTGVSTAVIHAVQALTSGSSTPKSVMSPKESPGEEKPSSEDPDEESVLNNLKNLGIGGNLKLGGLGGLGIAEEEEGSGGGAGGAAGEEDAHRSAMPLPTSEEELNSVPNSNLRKGSLLKDLLS